MTVIAMIVAEVVVGFVAAAGQDCQSRDRYESQSQYPCAEKFFHDAQNCIRRREKSRVMTPGFSSASVLRVMQREGVFRLSPIRPDGN